MGAEKLLGRSLPGRPAWPASPSFLGKRGDLTRIAFRAMLWNIGMVAGLLFLYLQFSGTLRSWTWTDSRCLLKESQLIPQMNSVDTFALSATLRPLDRQESASATSLGDREIASVLSTTIRSEEREFFSAAYTKDQEVRCFLSPQLPGDALLDRNPEAEWSVIAVSILAICCGLFSGLAPLFCRRRNGNARSLAEYGFSIRSMKTGLSSILACATAMVLGLVLLTSFIEISASRKSKDWVSNECVLEYKTKRPFTSENSARSIVYSYTFGERHFRSSDLGAFGTRTKPESLRQILDSHSPGDRLPCWVNPQDPIFARLLPVSSADLNLWRPIPVPLTILLLGTLLIWYWRKRCEVCYPQLSFAESSERGREKLRQWLPVVGHRRRARELRSPFGRFSLKFPEGQLQPGNIREMHWQLSLKGEVRDLKILIRSKDRFVVTPCANSDFYDAQPTRLSRLRADSPHTFVDQTVYEQQLLSHDTPSSSLSGVLRVGIPSRCRGSFTSPRCKTFWVIEARGLRKGMEQRIAIQEILVLPEGQEDYE